MKRILLFLLTNFAILIVLGVVYALLAPVLTPLLEDLGVPAAGLFLFAFVLGMGGSFISLLMSKFVAKRVYGITPIGSFEEAKTSDEQFIYQEVQDLAQKAGVSMPEVGIYQSPEPNAFATGAFRNSALIAASSGLMQGMTRDEARAVLAHEMAHVVNGDMVTMTLIQGVMNTFVIYISRILANVVGNAISRGEGTNPFVYFAFVIVFEIVLGILASLVTFAYSRRREYAADAGSAQLLGSAEPMMAALKKLETLTAAAPVDERGAGLETLKIGGRQRSWGGDLFRTHPQLSDRIEALQRWSPGVTRA